MIVRPSWPNAKIWQTYCASLKRSSLPAFVMTTKLSPPSTWQLRFSSAHVVVGSCSVQCSHAPGNVNETRANRGIESQFVHLAMLMAELASVG